MARQVGNALEDEAAQPLAEVQRPAPQGCDYFSELEASISEWASATASRGRWRGCATHC